MRDTVLVHDFLMQSAARFPDKTVLVCGDRRMSYRELDQDSNRLARALTAAGVARGDRVVVFLPNCAETALAIFAVLKAGAVFVPVNRSVKQDKLAYIIRNCAATALVTDPVGIGLIGGALHELSTVSTIVATCEPETPPSAVNCLALPQIFARFSDEPPNMPVIDQDLACLIYTSGSTGEPKGVVCGHNNVAFAAGSIITYLENRPEDIVINVLPFSFDYGLYQLLMVVRFGGTLVIENNFGFPAAVLRTIEHERVTGLPAVPTLISMLLSLDLGQYDLRSLRYISNTAAALPPTHIHQLQQRLPHVRIYSMYGMTECKRTLYLPPEELSKRPSSVGIAIPGTEVWVEDSCGRRLGPDQVGQLVVRGSHVMRGYWGDDELTNRVYRPGPTPAERVLYTGDLFRMDEEGYFSFVARLDDIIKSRGEKVAPREVEAIICELPGVHEAAVVGVPDEVLGEAIRAYVVTNDATLNEQQVRRHCLDRLENFMVPQEVVFVASLPRNPSGKIDRRMLVTNHA